jgi:hypothetical protein
MLILGLDARSRARADEAILDAYGPAFVDKGARAWLECCFLDMCTSYERM